MRPQDDEESESRGAIVIHGRDLTNATANQRAAFVAKIHAEENAPFEKRTLANTIQHEDGMRAEALELLRRCPENYSACVLEISQGAIHKILTGKRIKVELAEKVLEKRDLFLH